MVIRPKLNIICDRPRALGYTGTRPGVFACRQVLEPISTNLVVSR